MALIKKIAAVGLCVTCLCSMSGCSVAGLLAFANDENSTITNEQIKEFFPECDEEDIEAVKDLAGDLAGIAAEKYKEHVGEIDIGEMAENVDRDKVADFIDKMAETLKSGSELIKDIWGESEDVNDSVVEEGDAN